MIETSLPLTAEEREYLAELLETVLKDTRVEGHRTRTPSYRQHVLHREEVIVAVLNKLKALAESPAQTAESASW